MTLSIDYEIYGNGDGSLDACLFDPSIALSNAVGETAVIKFYVDVTMFYYFKVADTQKFKAISDNLTQLSRAGHVLALHIHPQWYQARSDNGQLILGELESHFAMRQRHGIPYLQFIRNSICLFLSSFPDANRCLRFGALVSECDEQDLEFFQSLGIECQSNFASRAAYFDGLLIPSQTESTLSQRIPSIPLYSAPLWWIRAVRPINKLLGIAKNRRIRENPKNVVSSLRPSLGKVVIPDLVQVSFIDLIKADLRCEEVLGHSKNLGGLTHVKIYSWIRNWFF